MDQAAIVRELQTRCNKASQRTVARELGISQAYLHDVLCGFRAPGNKILAALGIKRSTVYQRERQHGKD